jgi:hypothetical protein
VRRRGSVLPMAAFSLVALCGFVAFAVDLGMVATARTQLQNAADIGAAAGARRIDGSPSPDLAAATARAREAAEANLILKVALTDGEISVKHGAYHYDTAQRKFYPQFPPQAPDNYNLSQVDITHEMTTAFAKVFGIQFMTVKATATAAHRPSDVAIVLDYSGSMNNESDLWNNESYLGSANNSPNSNESVYPLFGHYGSGSATLNNTSGDTRVGKSNVSIAALGIPAMVGDYYQHPWGASPTPAFTAALDTYATTPGGDNFLKVSQNKGTTYAQTVKDVTGSTTVNNSFETKGYTFYTGTTFNGYTQGPRYWGKTFFVWPPDPTNDWRKKFFLKPGGSYPSFGGAVTSNGSLYDTAGNFLPPYSGATANYVINYKAILAWVAASPSPFPSKLRAGKICYYDAIPTDLPSACYDWNNKSGGIAYNNQNERFWKEYIDYALGVWRDPFGNIQKPGNPACSYGPDFAWGTVSVTAKPATQYMSYTDNPLRPRHRFWFGPMTLVQFLSDTGLLPGTAHDISMYPAKLGIQGALEDIRNNHPNTLVSLIMFARPPFSGEPAEAGRFQGPVYGLSRDYTGMINSMWFPPNSSSSDVRPWDANGLQTPRANGDYTGNTCTNYGLMLAYNQFSGDAALRSKLLGGDGRKGAARVVILETDGMANVNANAGFTDNGPYQSYYNIKPGDNITSGGTASTGALNVARKICALTTGSPDSPGFATTRKPVHLHCVAFGAVFEPDASGSEPANAMAFLQQLSQIGGTGFPASVTDSGSPYFYKLCTGNLAQRQTKLRQAFSNIMNEEVSISLVK